MPVAKFGNTVRIHYTGKLEDGIIFDSSDKDKPFEFTIGDGKIIKELEQAMIGMRPDESKTIQVAADNAFGPHLKDLVAVVKLDQIPENIKPKIGQQLEMNQEDNKKIIVRVTEVTDTSATLDANHPLAGKDLTFDIRLVEIL
ncbi:MAG: peptidylprolyl isomerase [Candidatus Latescibacteria bacterium]|jgi:peptidylprolyl isomerase|nr:peptidylprolyl isomerase [Candidatus Latescibacterota bacterium]